jgi:16S rRNA G1207 methylase RsmC
MTKRLDRRARGGGEGAGPRQTPREKRLARKQEREEPPVLRTPTTDQLLIDVLADGAELSRLRKRLVAMSANAEAGEGASPKVESLEAVLPDAKSGDVVSGHEAARVKVSGVAVSGEAVAGVVRVLATTSGRGQAAIVLAGQAGCRVVCQVLDEFAAGLVRAHVAGTRVEVVCAASFPEQSFDLVALALDHRTETELTRELVQAGAMAVVPGGRLVCATGKADDQLIHGELKRLFEKVTRLPLAKGCVYLATRGETLGKLKEYEATFAFRDGREEETGGRLIELISRPGVFSHRRLDAGARALLTVATVGEAERVIDIGCGTGAVALALAARSPGSVVLAIDSSARAVDCTARAAVKNALTNVQTKRTATGEIDEPGTWTVVLGNPPYFADYRIAELFVMTAARALAPGGRVYMVTKTPGWFVTRMEELFQQVESVESGAYFVVCGRKAGGKTGGSQK